MVPIKSFRARSAISQMFLGGVFSAGYTQRTNGMPFKRTHELDDRHKERERYCLSNLVEQSPHVSFIIRMLSVFTTLPEGHGRRRPRIHQFNDIHLLQGNCFCIYNTVLTERCTCEATPVPSIPTATASVEVSFRGDSAISASVPNSVVPAHSASIMANP